MRKTTLIPLFALLALTACSKPTVTGASADSITLRYDPALYSRDEMLHRAEEHCRKNGRAGARFDQTSKDAPLGFRYDVFACET